MVLEVIKITVQLEDTSLMMFFKIFPSVVDTVLLILSEKMFVTMLGKMKAN